VNANIKPIETIYKGYRFRSRLEARWAVFLDAMGIEWTYEREDGVDLGDLGWYLPDFWLPKEREWLEVKPAEPGFSPKRIYAAGKISRGDWRNALVDVDVSGNDSYMPWPHRRLTGSQHLYTGPYFTPGGGHGLSHGTNTHGSADIYNPHESGMGLEDESARKIFSKCLQAIQACDIFFAWIDSPDCYGTLAEIGFAHGIGDCFWSCRGA
jgi:hypothetical protein